jgi:COMPASS component SWD1
LGSFIVRGGAPIKSLQLNNTGDKILVNSSDRILRLYRLSENSLDANSPIWDYVTEFTDLINRLQWKTACFSRDGEFLVGGSSERAEHNIYLWNLEFGSIAKTLEGPKEGVMHVCVSVVFFIYSIFSYLTKFM